jgi:hypothetical protein
VTELVVESDPVGCLALGTMRDALGVKFAGFDLAPDDANLLLNEGHTELVVRSEWLRGAILLDPTGDAGVYSLPGNAARIRSISSAGVPLEQVSLLIAGQLLSGSAFVSGTPVWWPRASADGTTETIRIYPDPASDAAVAAEAVLYPPNLAEDEDEPSVPCEYRRGIVSYAAAQVYGAVEDDRDLMDANMADFETKVNRLRAHRMTRFGSGPVQMRVMA